MNMQDFRHAADRVKIADHCKEEVLGMKQMTTTRKPAIRIAAGFAAAAASLALVCGLGYSVYQMKQNSALIPATAPMEEQVAASQDDTSEAAGSEEKAAPDDREYPLFSRMTEEQRTKTFDWGTITLQDCSVQSAENPDDRYMSCTLRTYLNEDVERATDEIVYVELKNWMYDLNMQHKAGSNAVNTLAFGSESGSHEITMELHYPVPKEGYAVSLTLDDDGVYREKPEDDFLLKSPDPDYLLYEIQLDRLTIKDTDGNDKHVLFDGENESVFKFRLHDLPPQDEQEEQPVEADPDSEEIIEDMPEEEAVATQAPAEAEPEPANLLDQPVVKEYNFGTVELYDAYFIDDQQMKVRYRFMPAEKLQKDPEAAALLMCRLGGKVFDAEGMTCGMLESEPEAEDNPVRISAFIESNNERKMDCVAFLTMKSAIDPDQARTLPESGKVDLYVAAAGVNGLSEQAWDLNFTENFMSTEKQPAYGPLCTFPIGSGRALRDHGPA